MSKTLSKSQEGQMDEQKRRGKRGRKSHPHLPITYTCTSKSLTTWCLIIHSADSLINFYTQLSAAKLKKFLLHQSNSATLELPASPNNETCLFSENVEQTLNDFFSQAEHRELFI